MTFQYMLDTNVVSALIQEPRGTAARRVRSVGDRRLCCSVIVAGELRFGVANRGSDTLRKRVEDVLAHISVIPLMESTDDIYGQIRDHLKRMGQPIGSNDIWIAAHALHEGLTLVTANIDEFHRVPGLSAENWEI